MGDFLGERGIEKKGPITLHPRVSTMRIERQEYRSEAIGTFPPDDTGQSQQARSFGQKALSPGDILTI